MEEGTAIEVGTPFMGAGIQGWFLRIVLAVGAPFLGALTALCWAFLANALLDESEYQIEYRLEGAEEDHELLTTPEHLMTFEGDEAIARVRAGRFGWPWVEDVVPDGETAR